MRWNSGRAMRSRIACRSAASEWSWVSTWAWISVSLTTWFVGSAAKPVPDVIQKSRSAAQRVDDRKRIDFINPPGRAGRSSRYRASHALWCIAGGKSEFLCRRGPIALNALPSLRRRVQPREELRILAVDVPGVVHPTGSAHAHRPVHDHHRERVFQVHVLRLAARDRFLDPPLIPAHRL